MLNSEVVSFHQTLLPPWRIGRPETRICCNLSTLSNLPQEGITTGSNPCVTIMISFSWYFHGVVYTWYTGIQHIISGCSVELNSGHRKWHWTLLCSVQNTWKFVTTGQYQVMMLHLPNTPTCVEKQGLAETFIILIILIIIVTINNNTTLAITITISLHFYVEFALCWYMLSFLLLIAHDQGLLQGLAELLVKVNCTPKLSCRLLAKIPILQWYHNNTFMY